MTSKDELIKMGENDEGIAMAIKMMFEANENEEIRKLIIARENAKKDKNK